MWEKPVYLDAAFDHSKPAEWKELPDDASGKTYYYNSLTGETTWESPAQRPRVFHTGKVLTIQKFTLTVNTELTQVPSMLPGAKL